jgi:hypothetical protein
MRLSRLSTEARKLAADVAHASAGAKNEAQLRLAAEATLERACAALAIPWAPYQIDRNVAARGAASRFVDVAHGALIIEYEAPCSFAGGINARLRHAREQLIEYAQLLAAQEGREISRYVLLAWDGAHADFGQCDVHADREGVADGPAQAQWEGPIPFDELCARRVLEHLAEDGRPLVHADLLAAIAGPESSFGDALIPAFFRAIRTATGKGSSLTALMFREWRRLFGQVVGIQSSSLRSLLARQESRHGLSYDEDHAAYLFALNTYIALFAKLVAALALSPATLDLRSRRIGIARRIDALESGRVFEEAGLVNMGSGDFFSWYRTDGAWSSFAPEIEALIDRLAGIDFDTTAKSPQSTRDLFKGLYESFVPRALRHALGEFYTPDWLAEYGLDQLDWHIDEELLDPTCGSGTFLLEALRRRLAVAKSGGAAQLLQGLYGFDLNPLAVLSAKASLAVFIAPRLDPAEPVRLPVFLADAVNPAARDIDGMFTHVLQTELGPRSFRLPEAFVRHPDFYMLFARARELIDADRSGESVQLALEAQAPDIAADEAQRMAMVRTWETLVDLHRRGWNGIWCPIVADRFAAGAIGPVRRICGNPPWVKWSHLPPEYAAFIKPRCQALGAFSSDAWVGGIESDMSTVITLAVIDQFLADGGDLGFFITGTVFTNESSEGFRTFRLRGGEVRCSVLSVEDFQEIRPFDGLSNHPVFMRVRRGEETTWPVSYRIWRRSGGARTFPSAASFRQACEASELLARPVPGGNGHRPWLVGTESEHRMFLEVFRPGPSSFTARKGVTTDRNGIFWVRRTGATKEGLVQIENAADIGKTRGIEPRRAFVEAAHLFPLLRGRGVTPFGARVDPELLLLLPQRGMHGDPDLPASSPMTHRFLRAFKDELQGRSSFKRFQARAGHPWWSLWSTGPYTFSPYKVLWRELSGSTFAAAYVGSLDLPDLGRRTVVPDHKVYFIPVNSEDEAAYLTGLLNAPVISSAVGAYAAQLSLGASVAEYLRLPDWDAGNSAQRHIAGLARAITQRGDGARASELAELDREARALLALRG